ARGKDDDRQRKVLAAFRQILQEKGVEQVEEWLEACSPALSARIRDDAVWVNRHAAFTALQKNYPGLTTDWAKQTLFYLLAGEVEYFKMPDDTGASAPEPKDSVIKAGNWLT